MSALLATMLAYNLFALIGFFVLARTLAKHSLWVSRGFPPALSAVMPTLTREQKRRSVLFRLPLLAVLLLVPLVYQISAKLWLQQSFLQNWWEGFLLLFSFNLVDLIVIDWWLICFLTPRFVVAPGTEGHPGYKDYGFHFRAFLKGTVLVGLLSLVFASLSELVGLAL